MNGRRWFVLLTLFVSSSAWMRAAEDPAHLIVRTETEFSEAVAKAQPGSRILLASGEYRGGFHFSDVQGAPNLPIIIAAVDPQNPPVIRGGGNGIRFSKPAWLELRHLVFTGAQGNGLNIDDGGVLESPAHHILLRNLKIGDVGPDGNRDGIKISGVADFRIEQCTIERWGTGGGSGIDMVGCHRGLIQSNVFRHTDTNSSTGVQAKGGTTEIVIRHNRFENAGGRGVNIGGSTGLQFFRPPLHPGNDHYEAKDIRVEGNVFIGGAAPVAFVGIDGAVVRFNTLYRPSRWAFRILQETQLSSFVPSRNGQFTDNLVVFHSSQWVEGGVNVGPGTAPETFTIARNWWYCLDQPDRSRPSLPVEEVDGVYGRDPLFRDVTTGDLKLRPESPAHQVGATAL